MLLCLLVLLVFCLSKYFILYTGFEFEFANWFEPSLVTFQCLSGWMVIPSGFTYMNSIHYMKKMDKKWTHNVSQKSSR